MRICEKIRQPRWKYLKPREVITTPAAIPIATRPTSPIQRLSNAYLRKNAVANRISNTAIQPIQRRPINDSRSYALSDEEGGEGGDGGGGSTNCGGCCSVAGCSIVGAGGVGASIGFVNS